MSVPNTRPQQCSESIDGRHHLHHHGQGSALCGDCGQGVYKYWDDEKGCYVWLEPITDLREKLLNQKGTDQ